MTVTQPIRVSEAGDLLSLLPYVMGFHPEESVLVVLLRHGRLAMVARFDLAAFENPDQVLDRHAELMTQYGDCQVVLVVFTHDLSAGHDAVALFEVLTDPAMLIDSIITDDERWWSRVCTAGCCPPEGRPVEWTSVPATLAVSMGFTALAGRSDLVEQVAAPSPERLAQVQALHDDIGPRIRRRRGRARRERLTALVQRGLTLGGLASDAELVELAHLITDIGCRDAVWLSMRPDDAVGHEALWSSVVRVATDECTLPALCMVGAAAWIGGNGALLNCCLDRGMALREQLAVSYSMLDLLASISEQMVPPSAWNMVIDDE